MSKSLYTLASIREISMFNVSSITVHVLPWKVTPSNHEKHAAKFNLKKFSSFELTIFQKITTHILHSAPFFEKALMKNLFFWFKIMKSGLYNLSNEIVKCTFEGTLGL